MSAVEHRIAKELLGKAERGERAVHPTPDAKLARGIRTEVLAMQPRAKVDICDADGTPCYQPGILTATTSIFVSIPGGNFSDYVDLERFKNDAHRADLR